MGPSPAVALARARLAGMHNGRRREPDDPELIAAQQDLKTVKLADYIVKVVSSWPPLSDEQLDRVAAMLMTGRSQPRSEPAVTRRRPKKDSG